VIRVFLLALALQASAQKHLDNANKLLELNRPKDALREFQAAQALDPANQKIKAAIKKLTNPSAVGARHASPLQSPTPESLSSALRDASTSYSLSDLPRAESSWRRALLIDPSNPEAKSGLKRLTQ
jgi:tetratricopeptide (TPR) repeat protein